MNIIDPYLKQVSAVANLMNILFIKIQYSKNSTEQNCVDWTKRLKKHLQLPETICAINYSGWASDLGGIINLVDRQLLSLSRSERPPFSSLVDNTIARSTIDMPWRNFLRPEFRKKFYREVCPSFRRHLNFLKTQCRTGRKKPPCQSHHDSFSRFYRTPTCDRQTVTDRHRPTQL